VSGVPLSGYGVLVARAVERRREIGTSSPHYQVHVQAGGVDYRIAVNVLSAQSPPDVLFLAVDTFEHPVLDVLAGLPEGFSALPSRPQTGALDFVRANLFDPAAMRPLPPDVPGPDNDLSDRVEHYVQRAIADPAARLYAFGQRWGPEPQKPDQIFGFSPGNGIHDIHMNQGNSGSFTSDDGVWQDGALLFRFAGQWSAVFLAFQSQSWHTDDGTGHTIQGAAVPSHPPVRVVGAVINPAGPAPERETVTLLNASPDTIDLTGWSLADAAKNRFALSGKVAAGAAVAVPVAAPFALGNSGGAVTLLDDRELKVDGVAYSAADSADEGWTVVF
jgi:uncharacterized protein YukJ